MPIIFVLCTIGSFAIAGRIFDVYVMFAFGILGFILREMEYPMAPLVLGIVLGDLLDKSFRRGMTLSDGSLEPFFMRPISSILAAACVVMVLGAIPAVRRAAASLLGRITGKAVDNAGNAP
jgi:putative tricarboxylic transport membrane protein